MSHPNNQERPTLWIISERFYPDETSTAYIMTKYAQALSRKYNVKVITNTDVPSSNPLGDIEICKVKSPDIDKNSPKKRIFRLLIITLSLLYTILKRCKKGSKVLIVTNPAFIVPAVALIKNIKKFELKILVHDIFPENLLAAKLIKSKKNLLYNISRKIYNSSYSAADQLIVLGRDMKDVMNGKCRKKVKIDIIENWAEPDITYLPDLRPTGDEIVIQYAGNIGRVQGLKEFIDCFNQANNPNLKFILRGGGALEASLKEYVEKNNIKNVKFLGPYNRCEQNNILNSCDISLISLSDSMYGLGVPSKSYNIMAAGSRILCIAERNSEISLVVREYGIGYTFGPDEKDDIVDFMKSLSRDKIDSERNKISSLALDLVENKYSLNKIEEKIIQFI